MVRPTFKIAIVHDWLVRPGGAERVLANLLNLFPKADLFVLFHIPGAVSLEIESKIKRTSFIQRLPGLRDHYPEYLPLFPKAVESLPLNGYDLIISSSYCVAKGAKAGRWAKHICYCHTPMRYVWHQKDYYQRKLDPIPRIIFEISASWLRSWDRKTSARPDRILANSRSVAFRIEKYYGRTADVVYPPVDTVFFCPVQKKRRSDFFLTTGALVPYKNYEIAIAACNNTGHKLLLAGDGPERERLERRAGPNIKFLGWQAPEKLRELYRTCRALIAPGEEDFGIAMVEAQACGCPVIAYGKGGAKEIVLPDRTGVIFNEPSSESLEQAIEKFEKMHFNPIDIRVSALRFKAESFRQQLLSIVYRMMGG